MRMRLNRLSWLSGLLCAAVAAVVLAPAAPAAADAKRVSGAACFFGDGGVYRAHHRANQFLNNSGLSLVVTCPIIKESLGSPITVFVRTSATSNPVDPNSCRVVRRDGGGAVLFFTHQTTTTYADGSRDVNWSTPISAPASSHLMVQCSVPHLGAIFAVQWDE